MKTRKKFIETLDLTPTWEDVLPVYMAVLRNPDATAEGLAAAESELRRMAKLADLAIAAHRQTKK